MKDLIQTTKKSMGVFPLSVVRLKFDTVLEKGNYTQSKIPLYVYMCARARVYVCMCLCVPVCGWVMDGECVYIYEYTIIHI